MLMNSFKLTKENAQMLANQYGTPLEVISVRHIEANYRLLQERIPRLKIYYAIKANPATCILQKLKDLGSNFDVASDGEIEKLAGLNISGERMIYANPVKTVRGLKAAQKAGIRRMTFDSKTEVDKIAEYVPNAEVLARVKIDNSDAVVDLNIKFGAERQYIIELLKYAQTKGLKAAGICFHVGSQALSADDYLRAFDVVRNLIDKARKNGIDIKYVDIGGGLPAPALNENADAAEIMAQINKCIEENFADVELWAEPGRYMCASAVNIVTAVIGKQKRSGRDWYYLDDGIYGSFSGKLFDHWDYDIMALKEGEKSVATLAGPSCDSLDIVKSQVLCPQLETGDLLLAVNAGAYSRVSATTFNGFSLPQSVAWEE